MNFPTKAAVCSTGMTHKSKHTQGQWLVESKSYSIVPNVDLRIGTPYAGWFPIDLKLGTFDGQFHASACGYNILRDLVCVALDLLGGRREPSVIEFWCEPHYHALSIEPRMNLAHLDMVFFYHYDWNLRESNKTFETSYHTMPFVHILVRELTKLRSTINLQDFPELSWHEFPEAEFFDVARPTFQTTTSLLTDVLRSSG